MEISQNGDEHLAIALEVLGPSITALNDLSKPAPRRFSPAVVKPIIRQILLALDYLHTCCDVIYTGLYPSLLSKHPLLTELIQT